jgi:hypothetical protein
MGADSFSFGLELRLLDDLRTVLMKTIRESGYRIRLADESYKNT